MTRRSHLYTILEAVDVCSLYLLFKPPRRMRVHVVPSVIAKDNSPCLMIINKTDVQRKQLVQARTTFTQQMCLFWVQCHKIFFFVL